MRSSVSKFLPLKLRAKLKQASILWLHGFREACCLHRVIFLCSRSRQLLVRTGQCFLLNGFIFLGSIYLLNSVVLPTLQWILPDQCSQINYQGICSFGGILKLYASLRHGLVQLFYLFWFYPLYLFSFILSNLWYKDIASYGFAAMARSGSSSQLGIPTSQKTANMDRPSGLGGVMIGIAEQVYSLLLLIFFYLQAHATKLIPYFGAAFNFLLLSWMYAYYCFEYKWTISEVSLDRRLEFFESNWAFFAGFGSPCVLAVFFFSPLVSDGVMAILFPLFVLTATGSGAEQVISSQNAKLGGACLGRLPIFYLADNFSLWVLSFFTLETHEKLQDKAH